MTPPTEPTAKQSDSELAARIFGQWYSSAPSQQVKVEIESLITTARAKDRKRIRELEVRINR